MAATPILGLTYIEEGSEVARPTTNNNMLILDGAVGLNGVVQITASENIAAGDLVNFHNSTGIKARKAYNTAAQTGAAYAVCIGAVLSGAVGNFKVSPGYITKTAHGFTVGDKLYLSNTAGAFTNVKPSEFNGGRVVQEVGIAVDANTIHWIGRQDWDVPLRRGTINFSGGTPTVQALFRGDGDPATLGPVIVSNLGAPKPILFCSAADDSGSPGYLTTGNQVGGFYFSPYDADNSEFASPPAGITASAGDDHAAGYFPLTLFLSPNQGTFGLLLKDAIAARNYPLISSFSSGALPRVDQGVVQAWGGTILSDNAEHAHSGTPGSELLHTLTLPADTINATGAGDYLIIRAHFSLHGNVLSTKKAKIVWGTPGSGGTTLLETTLAGLGVGLANHLMLEVKVVVRDPVSDRIVSVGVINGPATAGGGGVTQGLASTVVTPGFASAVPFEFHGELAGSTNASGDIVLESCSVELHRLGE